LERIVIDETLPEKLLNLRSSVELVDKDGHLIAVVHPRTDPALYEMIGEEVSEEELDRRFHSDGPWYTTEEVIARLRKLP
jgi:hypothetical protein